MVMQNSRTPFAVVVDLVTIPLASCFSYFLFLYLFIFLILYVRVYNSFFICQYISLLEHAFLFLLTTRAV